METVLFSATDPSAVVAAIEQARAISGGARVATGDARSAGARTLEPNAELGCASKGELEDEELESPRRERP